MENIIKYFEGLGALGWVLYVVLASALLILLPKGVYWVYKKIYLNSKEDKLIDELETEWKIINKKGKSNTK